MQEKQHVLLQKKKKKKKVSRARYLLDGFVLCNTLSIDSLVLSE